MKIIMLKGPCCSHKTTTINLVYYQLLRHKAKIVEKRIDYEGSHDFSAVLSYAGKKVAIDSAGDEAFRLKKDVLQKYADCDFLIMANRNFVTVTKEVYRLDAAPLIIEKTVPRGADVVVSEDLEDMKAIVAYIS